MLRRVRTRLATERVRPLPCVLSLALVSIVTAMGEVAPFYIRPTHIALMYLLAVLIAAIKFGLWPALLTAVLSVGALDYFFIQPIYSFEVNTPQDVLLLAFLSVGAVVASGLAARLREQVAIAAENAATTAALYRFAARLAGTATRDEVVGAVVEQVAAMVPGEAAVFVAGELVPPAPLALPLRAAGEDVGVINFTPGSGAAISPGDRRLVETLAELAGIALGRQLLADRLAQMSIEKEADRLRSALLNSIAHDLTAPIASVATTLTSLSESYDLFDDAARRELIGEAEREAQRLHQFSANLIDIARLEAGVINARREPTDIGDLIGSALVRARPLLMPRRIVVEVTPNLPQVPVDPALLEQAMFHILENASKYTPESAVITVTGTPEPGGVSITIADDGPGLPADDTQRVFTKFYRAPSATRSSGTGLGLAICRGFIEAHGGTITATNRSGGGAVFSIFLPSSGERR